MGSRAISLAAALAAVLAMIGSEQPAAQTPSGSAPLPVPGRSLVTTATGSSPPASRWRRAPACRSSSAAATPSTRR